MDWVTPYLAVGPRPRLQSTIAEGPTWENLSVSGITRIIDLTDNALERKYARTYKIDYKSAMVRDHPEPRELLAVFRDVHDWIEEERKAGGKVYLHCLGGTGRSPTCAMAHLMAAGKPKQEAKSVVKDAHHSTWKDENTDNMERALDLLETRLNQKRKDLFLDYQNMGLRPLLEGKGIGVRDIMEISGNSGIVDDIIVEHLKKHPELLLITKDTGMAVKCENQNLSEQLLYVDESEAVAKEVLRRLGLKPTE